jgi:arylsulfatase A-like enzyme
MEEGDRPMPPPDRPNLLLIVTDQQRHDTLAAHLDRFGCRTPGMDSLFWRNRDWVVHQRPFFHVVSFLNPHDIYFLDPDAEDPFAPFVSDALASHVDLVPTMLDLAGLPPDADLPGRSLLPAVQRQPLPDPDGVFAEVTRNASAAPALRCVRTRRWKYIVASGGEEELYDLDADPWETANLAPDAGASAARRDLQERLRRHLERERDPFAACLARP